MSCLVEFFRKSIKNAVIYWFVLTWFCIWQKNPKKCQQGNLLYKPHHLSYKQTKTLSIISRNEHQHTWAYTVAIRTPFRHDATSESSQVIWLRSNEKTHPGNIQQPFCRSQTNSKARSYSTETQSRYWSIFPSLFRCAWKHQGKIKLV